MSCRNSSNTPHQCPRPALKTNGPQASNTSLTVQRSHIIQRLKGSIVIGAVTPRPVDTPDILNNLPIGIFG